MKTSPFTVSAPVSGFAKSPMRHWLNESLYRSSQKCSPGSNSSLSSPPYKIIEYKSSHKKITVYDYIMYIYIAHILIYHSIINKFSAIVMNETVILRISTLFSKVKFHYTYNYEQLESCDLIASVRSASESKLGLTDHSRENRGMLE